MDHQLKKQDSQSGEKTLSQVTDPKLIEVSREIFAEITKVHKSLNERRLNRLIDKNALVCQNSTELEKMFKDELMKELESHQNEYRKLDVYQEISKKLDEEMTGAFNDIQHMGYNIGESRFVDNLKDLSENIRSTTQFLKDSNEKINRIYKRIEKYTAH